MKPSTTRLLVVVGARPQFIKAAALSRAIRNWNDAGGEHRFEETLVHTGQHYDHALSQAFFDELDLPEPAVNLGVGSGPHGAQTAEMLAGLERAMIEHAPDWVVVFGDTNSTAAGALAAAKLKIAVAHVEAGLREHDRRIPEEVNKIVADHLADLCLAPTETALRNLEREGLGDRSLVVGDIMLDTTFWMLERLSDRVVGETLSRFGLVADEFALATTHRAATREDGTLLRNVLEALREGPLPVLLPLHPSTRAAIEAHGLLALIEPGANLIAVPPVGYGEMLALLASCRMVLTDSGGLIKEAYFFRKPCATLDRQTEWVETLEGGWNVVVGPDKARILDATASIRPDPSAYRQGVFGDGATARKILEAVFERS